MIYIKTKQDIELMRQACGVVKETLEFAERKIRAGMSTAELDELIRKFIVASDAQPSCLGYCGYPASACISLNDTVVHGIPASDVIIREGDIVSVDLCAYKAGFHGDGARTFKIGAVSDEKEKLVRVTQECFFKAVEHLKAGTPLYDIGAAVQKHAEANGFSVVRAFVGHGIGKEMHEDPSVPNYGNAGTGVRLKAGTVLAIEPMINAGGAKVKILSDGWTAKTIDGKPSAHYENTVAILSDGVEILTL